jgi:hypothetical protein
MKQKLQIGVLVCLVIVLGGIGWHFTRSTPVASLSAASVSQSYAPLGVESPAPRFWEIEQSRKTEYTKTLRNIFDPKAPPPEPDKNGKGTVVPPSRPKGPQPLPPPVPPPLPLTFFGYGTVPNGTSRRAFLTNKEDIYIVAEGDTLLGRFRILKINNANLEFEEISTGLKNTAPLNLEEAAAAGSPPTPPPAPTS